MSALEVSPFNRIVLHTNRHSLLFTLLTVCRTSRVRWAFTQWGEWWVMMMMFCWWTSAQDSPQRTLPVSATTRAPTSTHTESRPIITRKTSSNYWTNSESDVTHATSTHSSVSIHFYDIYSQSIFTKKIQQFVYLFAQTLHSSNVSHTMFGKKLRKQTK